MKAHELTLPGAWLERGYWLYVWEVQVPKQKKCLYYVGRTGDSSSLNAASPFNRMGQHLDLRPSASAAMLTKNLKKHGFTDLLSCEFRLIALGPLFPEGKVADRKNPTEKERDHHTHYRDTIAGLECKLEKTLREAGYEVMNQVKSSKPLDENLWKKVRSELKVQFPEI